MTGFTAELWTNSPILFPNQNPNIPSLTYEPPAGHHREEQPEPAVPLPAVGRDQAQVGDGGQRREGHEPQDERDRHARQVISLVIRVIGVDLRARGIQVLSSNSMVCVKSLDSLYPGFGHYQSAKVKTLVLG